MTQSKRVREDKRRAKRATSHRSPSRTRRQEMRAKKRADADLDVRAAKSGIKIVRSLLDVTPVWGDKGVSKGFQSK